MTDAAIMLMDGWRGHWELLGSPTFIYLGRHWPCVPSDLRRGMSLPIGPAAEDLHRSFTVPKSAMPIRTADQNEGWDSSSTAPTADNDVMPPQSGHKVILGNRDFEVDYVEEDAAGAFWIVHLVSPNS